MQEEESGHPFAVLSYQAVQVPDANSTSFQKNEEAVALPLGLRKTSIKQNHLKPNLGIWDCRVLVQDNTNNNNESALVNKLLSSVVGLQPKTKTTGNAETFVVAVDLSDPLKVEGAVSTMISSIVSHLEEQSAESKEEEGKKGGSTSLAALKSCTFGSATTSSVSSSSDDEKTVNLLLCALVPSNMKTTPTYLEKQSQNLILYHLHKFALEVDCTLVFVRPFTEVVERNENEDGVTPVKTKEEGGEEGEGAVVSSFGGGMVGTVSVAELAIVVRKVALGGVASLVEDTPSSGEEEEEKKEETKETKEGEKEEEKDEDKQEEEEEEKEAEKTEEVVNVKPQAIYTPKSHDADILKGVYLRNASCEGEWDAAKDDLGKALPPPPSTESTNTLANSGNKGGDHEWLGKLYQSVGGDASMVGAGDGGANDASTLGDNKSFVSPSVKGKKKVAGSTNKKGKKEDGQDGSGDAAAYFQGLLGK